MADGARWCAGGSDPAEGTAMAEPSQQAPGKPTRLSEVGAGGSGTAQGTIVPKSSGPTNG